MTEQYKDLSFSTSSAPRFSTHKDPGIGLLTMWRFHCTWGPSCCSWTWWHTSSSCRWGEGRWCTPPQTAGRFPASATSGHWLPPLMQEGSGTKRQWKLESKRCKKEKKKEKEEEFPAGLCGKKNVKIQYVSLPLTVTLCSPVLGWVKISTWMDTSPTASSTPEPDRVERQHEAPWVSLTWGNVSFLSQSKQTHANHRCYIVLLLPKHDATLRPNPVRCINGPAYSNNEWTKLACFQLITCYRRTRNEPSDLRVCVLWTGQPVKAAMSGLCLFISVMLAIHCSAVHLQYT